ncbi:MAG: hypothetical protein HKM90_02575 [Desulfobacteraceae bacterium]|nr:hypothetical protein [Desulfobacteraceae bacterium]
MDEMRILLCVVFGFGVVLESLLLVGFNAEELGIGFLVSLGGGLVFFVVGLFKAPELGFYTHILIGIAIYSGVFAIIFRKRIMPIVSEKTLLVLNMALWYLFFAYSPMFPFKIKLLICLILIPMTISVNLMAFVDHVVGPGLTLLFYTWFLVMIVSLGLGQFPFWNLSLFFGKIRAARLGFVDVLLTGMVFSYIVIHAFYILALIPVPYHREQSFGERWREVKKHAKVLIEKYSHQQLRQEEALLIVLILGGLLFANLLLQLIPDHLAINSLIVIVPQLISKRFSVAVQRSDELMSS